MSSPSQTKTPGPWMQTLAHFWTFVRLRWTIRKNQMVRESIFGKIIMLILMLGAFFGIAVAGIAGCVIGYSFTTYFPTDAAILLWDAAVIVFLIAWTINLVAELNRGDAITLDRIMHLPVSPGHAFTLNYLLSLINLPFAVFLASTVGVALGAGVARGPYYLLLIIPILVYLAAVTAITNQFQGWLAAMMSNPRRRRTIMVVAPFVIVVLTQIPVITIQNFAGSKGRKPSAANAEPPSVPAPIVVAPDAPPGLTETPIPIEPDTNTDAIDKANTDKVQLPESTESAALPTSSESPQEGGDGFVVEASDTPDGKAIEEAAKEKRSFQESVKPWTSFLYWANIAIPPLWLVAAQTSILSGNLNVLWIVPLLAGTAYVSLRKNYHSTIRYFQNGYDTAVSGKQTEATSAPVIDSGAKSKIRMIDYQLPFVHEQTSAVVASTWTAMQRAPEFKMQLIAPLVAPLVLIYVAWRWNLPGFDELRAAAILGVGGFGLLTASGIMGNQFGHDRSGFRAWVLSPIPRDRILLGRNIALGIPVLLVILLLMLVLGVFWRMNIDKYFFLAIAMLSFVGPYGLIINLMSILAPFALPPGSMQPKQFTWKSILFSLLISMLLPTLFSVVAIPLGIEWLIGHFYPALDWIPFAVLMEIPLSAISIAFYVFLLPAQGRLLQKREIDILQLVTSQVE